MDFCSGPRTQMKKILIILSFAHEAHLPVSEVYPKLAYNLSHVVYSKGVNLKNIYGVHRACRYLVKLYSELQLLVEGLICLLSALFYVPTDSSKPFMKLQHFKCKVVLKIDDYCAFLLFLPTYVITMWLRSPIEAQFVLFNFFWESSNDTL